MQYFTTAQACAYVTEVHMLRCGIDTMNKHSWLGTGPKFSKHGNTRYYAKDDLDRWARGRITKRVSKSSELRQKQAA